MTTRKHTLFLEGEDETSERRRLALARAISALDARARAKDRQLAYLHKSLRIIAELLQIEEDLELFQELRVDSILPRMRIPLEALTTEVGHATARRQFEIERLGQDLEPLEWVMVEGREAELDKDIRAIMAGMEAGLRERVEASSGSTMD
jgi:hypothetical protein